MMYPYTCFDKLFMTEIWTNQQRYRSLVHVQKLPNMMMLVTMDMNVYLCYVSVHLWAECDILQQSSPERLELTYAYFGLLSITQFYMMFKHQIFELPLGLNLWYNTKFYWRKRCLVMLGFCMLVKFTFHTVKFSCDNYVSAYTHHNTNKF